LEHRQELVGTFAGVTYYNDSISTIPQAAIAAMQTIKNVTFLLLGGYDRDIDYTPMINFLVEHPVKHVLYTGKAGTRMFAMLKDAHYQGDIKNFKDLNEAFEIIKNLAKPGDVCLLSPAAASYDQYRNFEERGRIYKDLARLSSSTLR
jgi:UDP-N-acetylmuramoylalanine--D-glutamate ligase